MANPTPTRRSYGSSLRSHSPVKFYTSSSSETSSPFQNRSSSPTRINPYGLSSPSNSLSAVRFSIDHRPISSIPRGNNPATGKKQLQTPKRMCMCSPTSHPGSFRCNLHKNSNNHASTTSYPSNPLIARRSAMTNSLVRIGTVEGGDLVKRALSVLIRPSSHQQRRRTSFQRTPSRLSVMITADDLLFCYNFIHECL